MHWFLDLGMRNKLFASFGLMIALLVAVTVTGYLGVTTIQKSQKDLYEKEFANATDLLFLRSSLNRTRASILHMLLAADRAEQESWRRDIENRVEENDARLDGLIGRNADDPPIMAKLRDLQANLSAYREVRNRQIALILDGKAEEAKALAFGLQMDRYQKLRAEQAEAWQEGNDNGDDGDHRDDRSCPWKRTILHLLLLVNNCGTVNDRSQFYRCFEDGLASSHRYQ